MSSDGGGGGLWALVVSPAARTAALAVCATAALGLALRSNLPKKPPKVPDKDFDHERSSRRPRSSFSSSSLLDSKNSVAIFWDVDNCSPPTGASGHSVAQSIRRAAQAAAKHMTGSDSSASIVSFKAYLELTTEGTPPSAARVQLHSELQGSGVSLIDTPKSGRKDVADKMMITDLLSFAIDKRPPAMIILLSGDRDFAYPLGILRNRGYEILLVLPPVGATPILEASANYVMKWRQDVLGLERDGQGRLYDKAAREYENSGGRVVAVKELESAKAGKAKAATTVTPTSTTANGVVNSAAASASSHPPVESAPVKALKGPGAPPVPVIFHPLVVVLEQMRKEGNSRPLRSMCAVRLQSQDAKVYEKAGATSWGDYVAVAEAAGIVTLGEGSKPGREWIALRSIEEGTAEMTKGFKNGVVEKETKNGVLEKETKNGVVEKDGAGQQEVAIFHPLIEVYKSLKSGLPRQEYPTVVQITATLVKMSEVGLRDAYKQAKVNNFNDYMKLAEQAKVARLARSEMEPSIEVVQLHPKYVNLHTGVITPSSNEARMIDTSKTVAPPTPSSSSKSATLVGMLPFGKKAGNKDSQGPPAPQRNPTDKVSSTLTFAHQPSGEKIHVTYFPLANLLLTQRAEGKQTSGEQFVQSILVRHPKITHLVSSPEGFAAYIDRAERDHIISVEEKLTGRMLRLEPRLCVGEGEDKHKGFAKGENSTRRGDSTAIANVNASPPAREAPLVEQEEEVTTTSSFGTEAASAQDRLKFKPLIDTLVSLRRESAEEGSEPQRGKVSSALVSTYPIDGKVVSPGAWIQAQGYSGFLDFYQAAQRKGFIHLISNNKERIRLAQKYESMFFPTSR